MSGFETVFWISIGFIVYTYFLYPIILTLIAAFFPKKTNKQINIFPSIALLVSTYNEEKVIEEKVKNMLSLDYPKDKLNLYIISDGSIDRTNEILKQYKGSRINIILETKRKGKTAIINNSVPIVSSELIIISDADAIMKKNSIKKLIGNFSDKNVGCVTGKIIIFRRKEMGVSGGNLYDRYDNFLKERENRIHSNVFVSGSLIIFRKKLFHPCSPETTPDCTLPSIMIEKGYRTIYDPEAVAYTIGYIGPKAEFKRRVRITNRELRFLFSLSDYVSFLKHPIFTYHLFSRKLLRLFIPFFLIASLVASGFLSYKSAYFIIFILQSLFYICALLGFFLKNVKWNFIHIIFYFCSMNLAIFMGWIGFLIGKGYTIWEPVRR